MIHLGQPVLEAMLTADTLEYMTEGVLIAASVGKDDTVPPASLCSLDSVVSLDALPLSCGRSRGVAVP
jgi:hypothetical protein